MHTYSIREVLEEIEQASELLEQVPSMSFDRLRPVLAKHGLSEVGTLADLSARVTRVLEQRIKGAAGGGGLSKFGERAARVLFRMVDKVRVPLVEHAKAAEHRGVPAVVVGYSHVDITAIGPSNKGINK